MEIKKCTSCGSFITSNETLCSKCANKNSYDQTVLKNYFEMNQSFDSISVISETTGVAPSAVEKYMLDNNYLGTTNNPTSFSSIQY